MRPASRVETSHEDVFLQRYDSLLAWACRLCGQDRQQAEDLVHDAFLAFTVARTDLIDIENVDGYLRGMLRKLHVSAVRRATRGLHTSLSLIDHESADLALRAAGAATVEAKHELACVCRYACARKGSSKAGSVLLLRFFHGYFPSEIAQIARSSVRAIDEWLRIARREAKLFRDAPDRLRFLQEDTTPPLAWPPLKDVDDPVECLRAIQAAILGVPAGRCSSRRELEAFYRSSTQSMETSVLAHVVGCRPCLERVNRLLGLASLDERSPHDMIGPNRGGPSSPAGSTRASTQVARRREQRWRLVYEHRAAELQIVVNGFLVGSHTIGRAVTRQTVAVTLDEPVGSVEVFGERGRRLAFLDVEPQPGGMVEQDLSVPLTDDRHLRVRISFARPWPEIDVEYEDPHWRDGDISSPLADAGERLPKAISPPLLHAWRRWNVLGARPRWKLALAVGSLVLLVSLTPASARAWAAEQVALTFSAMVRELTALSSRLWRPRPLTSRPLLPYAMPPTAHAARPDSSELAVATTSAPPAEAVLVRAEIDAMARLDAIEALVGGQIDVRRIDHAVLVRGVVDSDARQQEVARALHPLRRQGVVRVDVSSVTEQLRRRPSTPRAVRYEPMAFEVDGIPAAAALRAGLARRPEWSVSERSATDLEVRRIATASLNDSLDARVHAAVVRMLAERYDAAGLQALDRPAFEAWRVLIASHARAARADLKRLRERIEPLLSAPDAGGDSTAREPDDAASINQRAALLASIAVGIDEDVRAGLSASSAGAERVVRLHEPSFWATVRRAEQLAEALIP